MSAAIQQQDQELAEAVGRQVIAKAAIAQWRGSSIDELVRGIVMLSLEWQRRAWRKKVDALLSRSPEDALKLLARHDQDLMKARELHDLTISLRPELSEPGSGFPPSWIGPSR